VHYHAALLLITYFIKRLDNDPLDLIGLTSRNGILRTIAAVQHQRNQSIVRSRSGDCRTTKVLTRRAVTINHLSAVGVHKIPNLEATPIWKEKGVEQMSAVPAANPLRGLMGLLTEITRCQDAGAVTATAVMVYIGIDVMAFLSMPAGQDKQGRQDFIAWVNQYLRAAPESTYQYEGRDVYGARCALLHSYAVEADYHQQNPDVKKFGYHDGGKHAYNRAIDDRLVIIGINSLVYDFIGAFEAFVRSMMADAGLRGRVAERIPRIVDVFPFSPA